MTTEITTPKAGVRYFTTKRERREAKRAIAKYMKQGMKQKDIATLMGVPHSTVTYHASHPMPVKHRKPKAWTRVATDPAQVEQIQDLWEGGAAASAIAKTVGVSLSTVHRNKNRWATPLVREADPAREGKGDSWLDALVPMAQAVFRSPAITRDQIKAFLDLSTTLAKAL